MVPLVSSDDVTVQLAITVLALTLVTLGWRRGRRLFSLGPAHDRQTLPAFVWAYLTHLYHGFPACVFKWSQWKTAFHPDRSLEQVRGDICVVTGVRADGGIGFESCLALIKAGAKRVYAGMYVPQDSTHDEAQCLQDVAVEMRRRLEKDGLGQSALSAATTLVPVPMDLTDFKSSYGSAKTLISELTLQGDIRIDCFLGTVGMGHDRPGDAEGYKCRYTENDSGVEYQTGVNAVGTMVLLLSLLDFFIDRKYPGGSRDGVIDKTPAAETSSSPSSSPPPPQLSPSLSATSSDSMEKQTYFSTQPLAAADSRRRPARIVLTSSIAHFWATLPPFTVPPRYESWKRMRADGSQRSNAGRYSFSKLVQLHLLTTFSRLLDGHSEAHSRPHLLALHPGEVYTPFLASFLPDWWMRARFGHWNNAFWCYTPFKGAWTGLYACVVDVSKQTTYGYTYLTGLCTVTEPSMTARDEELVRGCWDLFGPRLTEWFRGVGEDRVVEFLKARV